MPKHKMVASDVFSGKTVDSNRELMGNVSTRLLHSLDCVCVRLISYYLLNRVEVVCLELLLNQFTMTMYKSRLELKATISSACRKTRI